MQAQVQVSAANTDESKKLSCVSCLNLCIRLIFSGLTVPCEARRWCGGGDAAGSLFARKNLQTFSAPPMSRDWGEQGGVSGGVKIVRLDQYVEY